MKATKILLVAVMMLTSTGVFAQQQKNMSREELLQISDIGQRANTFSQLSGDNQYQIWMDKFDELLRLNFSKPEKEHIQKLKDFIADNKEALYSTPSVEAMTNMQKFSVGWTLTAQKELGWSNELIYYISQDLGHLTNKDLEDLKKK